MCTNIDIYVFIFDFKFEFKLSDLDLLCLMPLSAIFQLYHGDQF